MRHSEQKHEENPLLSRLRPHRIQLYVYSRLCETASKIELVLDLHYFFLSLKPYQHCTSHLLEVMFGFNCLRGQSDERLPLTLRVP